MYHIANDLRAKKSAGLICKGLGECLSHKALADITVTEIAKHSGVGRTTFYRLFDNLEDVLIYQCDDLFEKTIQNFQEDEYSPQEYMKFYIRQCLEHIVLIKAIVGSGRMDVLFQSHKKYHDILKRKIMKDSYLTEEQTEYILAFLTSAIASMMLVCQHESQKTAEELYHDCSASIKCLADLLENGRGL